MKDVRVIENKKFPYERDLYGETNLVLKNCSFDGVEDGESALKETETITLQNCYMNLRYPIWHSQNVKLDGVEMTENCRASLWYTNGIDVKDSKLFGIKAVRECDLINIENTKIISDEFGWKSSNITIKNTSIDGKYNFLLSKYLKLDKVEFSGKYSFQYVENVEITDSYLDTKDAFWHAKNVVVKNSVLKGEYLAWYSEGLTLINCRIIGTQPLCYCKNLKLIDCTMEGTDFSFEYSEVDATVIGEILSVKNPISGKIYADKINQIILTDDSKYECNCDIVQKNIA